MNPSRGECAVRARGKSVSRLSHPARLTGLLLFALIGCLFAGAGQAAAAPCATVAGLVGRMPVPQARLNASDGEVGDGFGSAVACSGDTMLVGAPLAANKCASIGVLRQTGAAYIFTRSGTTWTQQAKLVASDAYDGGYFGHVVALDGDTALISGYDVQGDRGAVYVFVRSGTTWTQQAELRCSERGEMPEFGSALALSGDTALVGAFGEPAAYVFTRSGTTWTQQAELTYSGAEAYESFGCAVSLCGDTAVIGAPWDGYSSGPGDYPSGAAYIFTRSGTTWTQQAKLTAADGSELDRFGSTVALDGDTALVGAWGAVNGFNSPAGAVYAFICSGTTWTQQAKIPAASDVPAAFGYYGSFGAAVSLDGSTALVGAPNGSSGAAVYMYTCSGTTWTQQGEIPAASGCACALGFGYPVSLSGDTAVLGDCAPSSSAVSYACAFTGSNGTWTQQAMLTGTPPPPWPTINTVSRKWARPGVTLTITGANFGAVRGKSRVMFGTVKSSKYFSWNATRITCKVPRLAKPSHVCLCVRTAVGTSDGPIFHVLSP